MLTVRVGLTSAKGQYALLLLVLLYNTYNCYSGLLWRDVHLNDGSERYDGLMAEVAFA